MPNYNSPDGLPRNPYPQKSVTCPECFEDTNEPECPNCGHQIEYEPDYEAGQKEYDKYE